VIIDSIRVKKTTAGFLAILALPVLLSLPACKAGKGLEKLTEVTDETSLERLAAMPADSKVLLSLQGHEAMEGVPDLGEEGRRLSSFGKAYLVEVPRALVLDLAETPGLKSIVVWGDAGIVQGLDTRLRLTMLSRVSGDELRQTPVTAVARFEGDGLDLRHSLEKMGARTRSVNAGVVTLDATVDVLFDILARSDLVSMAKPILQKPLKSE